MKDIKGYEGLYAITSCGKVWSYRKQKFMSPADNGHGYLHLVLTDASGNKKHHRVHRLVAEAYIPNPDNKPEVNHKDQIRNHNWVDNLEWATAKENVNYSSQKGKPKIFSKIRCVETGEIYNSCVDAALAVQCNPGNIRNVIYGKQKTARGYHWERYYEEVAA